MSVLGDAGAALAQTGDPAFRRVLFRGIGWTLALLAAFYALVIWGLNRLLPDTVTLPLLGPVGWLDDLASGAGLLLLLAASVFLMVPVASAVTSLFLDDVTDAVEARHYPGLPPAPRLGLADSLRESLGFFGLIILANAAALLIYLVIIPVAPLVFLAMNGFLLGREYFQLVARRRLGAEGARRMRRRHAAEIWIAGTVMAAPLVVPILNLIVPVLGAATFTHLFHRLNARAQSRTQAPSGRTSRRRAD